MYRQLQKIWRENVCLHKSFSGNFGNSSKISFASPKNCLLLHLCTFLITHIVNLIVLFVELCKRYPQRVHLPHAFHHIHRLDGFCVSVDNFLWLACKKRLLSKSLQWWALTSRQARLYFFTGDVCFQWFRNIKQSDAGRRFGQQPRRLLRK